MNRGTVVAVCAATLIVGVALGAAIRSINMRQPAADPSRPVAQPLAAGKLGIDPEKRYDVHCAHQGGATLIYKRCKVLGYTGHSRRTPADYEEFGRPLEGWLELELEDGRHAYIMPASVFAVETSAP